MPAASSARRSPRFGSSANSFRRCRGAIVAWWACSADQAGRWSSRGVFSVIESSYVQPESVGRKRTGTIQRVARKYTRPGAAENCRKGAFMVQPTFPVESPSSGRPYSHGEHGSWVDRRPIRSGNTLNACARAAATQHAAKQVLRILEIGKKIDLAAPVRVLAKQVVQEPQRGEILER